MFSQEDLEAYNRVQSTMELQRQLQNRAPKRGRVARIAAWVLLVLFLATTTAAAFLGYNVLYLNNELLKSQGNFARVVTDRNESSTKTIVELNETLNQANENVHTLNRSLDTERNERNAAVAKLNRNVEALTQQVQEERQRGNREIEKANGIIADKEERINYYTEVNVGLEESVTQLDASVHRLESANGALSREKDALQNEKNGLQNKADNLTRQVSGLQSRNRSLQSRADSLSSRVTTLEADLRRAKAQQITIPACSSSYYTVTGGKLSCVARNTSAFQSTQVETKSINLLHSGTVNLRINRSGELGSARSMEILEHAVKTIEEYMGQPIPLQSNEIRLDFVEELSGDVAGLNKESHIEILQEYDVEPPWWSEDALGIIIAHEVAHYYWRDERTWLNEGAAEILAIYSENKRVGRPMTSQNKRCTQAYSISDLERRKYAKRDGGFTCNYSLGEGLFLDLYNNMAEADFSKGFRNLLTEVRGNKGEVYQVRSAYPNTEKIQKVIDKWYGYREQPEAHWPDESYLAYYTWQEGGEWWHKTQDDNPCALRISYDETRRRFKHHSYSLCQYTGQWDDNGDLLVTIEGTIYRAVETVLSSEPNGKVDEKVFSRRTGFDSYTRLSPRL